MLVLSRNAGQGIQINANIRVYVLRDEQGSVQLGIEAPRSVPVARLELLDHANSAPARTMQSGRRR